MAATYKNARLQGSGTLTTYQTLYNTSPTTSAVISTISVCNTSSSDHAYRIAIMDSAGTPVTADYIAFDSIVSANDTSFISVGITLSASQYIRVSSASNTIAFVCFISEIS